MMDLAIVFLRHACGGPPAGCKLDVVYQDHDRGTYPSIALAWDPPASVMHEKIVARTFVKQHKWRN